ncbi:MAG: protoporphyrinogen oxidase [Bryobacterales bacterium]|nr:protoporphyrinogen oxidase [Bryobacterales bacterium]
MIGGGISGLSAAYYLNRAGVEVTLVESSPRLGGVITTETVEGCVIEGGPDSFLAAKPAAMELIHGLGLGGEVIGSNDSGRVTYVRRHGRLTPLPDGLMMIVPTRVLPMAASSLLGWETKLRMGLEWFRKPVPAGEDRSVAALVREHYGQEAVDYLAEPLLSGVYGGDPEQLSATSVLPRFVEYERKYGSLTRGTLVEMARGTGKPGGARPAQKTPLFRTLKGGLGSLTAAIETALDRTRVVQGTAEAVEEGRVRVNGAWLPARHVVAACPAHAAARLLPIPELAGITYSSSMTVALGYSTDKLAALPPGFGFLIPKRERRRLVACTFVGNKFAHRCPPGMGLLRCFLGGAADHAVLGLDDESAAALVRDELRSILGLEAAPDFVRISRWPRSMAQYTVGHAARLAAIQAAAARLPWLSLSGNAYNGIGIPDCIAMSKAAAHRLASGEPLAAPARV